MLNEAPTNMIITSANVDLTNCDREQIHIPGSIQPHGALLVVDKVNFEVIQVSRNTNKILKIDHKELINSPLSTIINQDNIELISTCLNKEFAAINPLKVEINQNLFNAIVHDVKDWIIVEFEPIDPQFKNDFISFYRLTKEILDQIQTTQNFQELSQVIVENIAELTGFDRVLVYRFAQDNSGHVIAEKKRDYLESFLGLRYPATDVPKPARRLYLLNYIRLICDINYQPVALPNHPETNEPFDLSFSTLRSVSPIHVEYLRNMGVQASMSISIIHEDKLWGLIACHHYTTRYLPYEVRVACEFLGKVMSLNLIAKAEQENLQQKMRLKAKASELFDNLAKSLNIRESLLANSNLLASLVDCHGLAVCLDGEFKIVGITPQKKEIQALAKWVRKQEHQDIFVTDCLSEIYSPAMEFRLTASGVLLLYLNRVEQSYIIWFRPEVTQTVSWAGNPNKNVKMEKDGSFTLSPRKSFELWQQTVTGRSLPWEKYEIQQVMEFRNLLVDIIFKKSNELVELNFELQRSNDELDSFAYIASHDLKEPLRGIYNYSYLLLEDYGEQLDESGAKKLNTLMSLTKRMEKLIEALLHYSRLGRQELSLQSIDLQELIVNEIKLILEASQQTQINLRIPKKLPLLIADKTLVEELFMNLMTNGLKYNDKPEKWLEIGYIIDSNKSVNMIFYVRDNGIGIEPENQEIIFRIFKRLHGQKQYGGGTGAGLTIVKKIIERHGGKIWIESIYGQETTFYFTLAGETENQ